MISTEIAVRIYAGIFLIMFYFLYQIFAELRKIRKDNAPKAYYSLDPGPSHTNCKCTMVPVEHCNVCNDIIKEEAEIANGTCNTCLEDSSLERNPHA